MGRGNASEPTLDFEPLVRSGLDVADPVAPPEPAAQGSAAPQRGVAAEVRIVSTKFGFDVIVDRMTMASFKHHGEAAAWVARYRAEA